MDLIPYPVIDVERTGEKLHMIITQSPVTNSELAGFLGFSSQRALYKWYRGETLPTIDNFYALSMLLGIPINHMIIEKKSLKKTEKFWILLLLVSP